MTKRKVIRNGVTSKALEGLFDDDRELREEDVERARKTLARLKENGKAIDDQWRRDDYALLTK